MPEPDRFFSVRRSAGVFALLALAQIAAPANAHAYIDPGTSGLMAQFLYVLFYGALAVFAYFFRSLKARLAALREFLVKLFCRPRS